MSPAVFDIRRFGRLDSTSDHAKLLAQSGAPSGTIVTAREQEAGRGRQGRPWTSPPGNLYMSLLLRPEVTPVIATQLGFVAAVALADCVDELLGAERQCRLKWPNDALVGGRKVGGILLEAETGEFGLVDWVVIGIGLNLASHPVDTRWPAISLAAVAGAAPSVDRALAVLSRCLAAALYIWERSDFAVIRENWLGRAYGIGETASAAGVEGIFEDLASDGALVLATSEGLRRIAAGDVQFAAT